MNRLHDVSTCQASTGQDHGNAMLNDESSKWVIISKFKYVFCILYEYEQWSCTNLRSPVIIENFNSDVLDAKYCLIAFIHTVYYIKGAGCNLTVLQIQN
jgi:hypothetical protein